MPGGTRDSRLQKFDDCCGTHPTPLTATEFFNRLHEVDDRPAPSDEVKNVCSHTSILHRPLCRGAYLNTRTIYLCIYLFISDVFKFAEAVDYTLH